MWISRFRMSEGPEFRDVLEPELMDRSTVWLIRKERVPVVSI